MELDFDNIVLTHPLVIPNAVLEPLWKKPPVEAMRLRNIQSVNNFILKYEERIVAVLSFLTLDDIPVNYKLAHLFTPVPQDPGLGPAGELGTSCKIADGPERSPVQTERELDLYGSVLRESA